MIRMILVSVGFAAATAMALLLVHGPGAISQCRPAFIQAEATHAGHCCFAKGSCQPGHSRQPEATTALAGAS